ncbi:MAG: RelA/SpoT family protein [Acidiferrobacterales bacterium]|nr:RelA/SpoT family protein [Acidiferrobacterales bacterium]
MKQKITMNEASVNEFSTQKRWHLADSGIGEDVITEVLEIYGSDPTERQGNPIDVIAILTEAEADWEMAAISVLRGLHPVSKSQIERIGKRFGTPMRQLYESALQLDSISLAVERGTLQSGPSSRKIDLSAILVAMVDDPRVVVIHLAELLVKMRRARDLSEVEKNKMAQQMLSVYTPLANKLGIWRLKWELEDLSFKFLKRPEFDRIARLVDERRVEREQYVVRFVAELQALMDRSNISATVNGRAKHLYGIWNKLQNKGLNLESLYDLRAVRILVPDIASCYSALGAVHASWAAVEGEFDDYIAVPKPNGYRSLHTAVSGPDSKTVEVQIRTVEMHNDCEFGVAAHWKYKENAKSSAYQDRKVRLLRQILEWKEEMLGSKDGDSMSVEGYTETVFAFTPAGNVIELPLGATPIDFAYAVHTEVGHRCRGAMVNGRIVPLTYVLRTGDWVEIRTVKSGGPSRDWLNSNEGFTVTSRAQARIRRWFKLEEYGRYQAQGKLLLEKEFNRQGLTKVNLEKLAGDNGFRHSQDLLTAIGMKELKPSHAVTSLIPKQVGQADPYPEAPQPPHRKQETMTLPLSVLGVGELLTRYASCCGPLPGDDVIGYVTVARGITIHRPDCGNLKRMLQVHPERMVAVNWETDKFTKRPVDIEMVAEGHPQLLQDVTTAITQLGLELLSVSAVRVKHQDLGKIYLSLEVGSAEDLKKALARLRQVDRVLKVNRLHG